MDSPNTHSTAELVERFLSRADDLRNGIKFYSEEHERDYREAADRLQHLEDRLAETQMLASKWMEAHDKLHAGKPYEFPKPADLPDRLQHQDRLREDAEEAMSDALAGWRYIRKMHGDLYGVGWDRVERKLAAALTQSGNE